MSQGSGFTKQMARNMFWGGSVFFALLFAAIVFHTEQRIPQRDAGVRIGTGIEQNECDAVLACLLNPIDELAFVVALKSRQRSATLLGVVNQSGVDLIQRGGSVNLRLSGA